MEESGPGAVSKAWPCRPVKPLTLLLVKAELPQGSLLQLSDISGLGVPAARIMMVWDGLRKRLWRKDLSRSGEMGEVTGCIMDVSVLRVDVSGAQGKRGCAATGSTYWAGRA